MWVDIDPGNGLSWRHQAISWTYDDDEDDDDDDDDDDDVFVYAEKCMWCEEPAEIVISSNNRHSHVIRNHTTTSTRC